MKSIYLKNEKLQNVFNELKDNFKGTLTTFENQTSITMESDIAKGNIEGVVFDKETAYIQFNVIFHDDVRISMELANDLPVFFTYCFDGVIQHSFGEQGDKKILRKDHSGILRSTSNTNSILYFKKNIPINFSIIRTGLNTVENSNNEQLIKKIKSVFFRTKSDYLEVKPTDPKIIHKIQELNAVTQKGIIGNLLKNRISQNILEIEIEQHIDVLSQLADTISSFAIKQINEVKRVTNTTMNLSLEVFTTEFWIKNSRLLTNKLQKEFKFLLNRPLQYFLIFMRIERGRI